MTARLRGAVLLGLAVALVAAVLGVQVAAGGGRFEPLRPADPCTQRPVASRSAGIDGLTERLVLVGIDEAACRLGVSREAYTLDLATGGGRSDAEIDALHDGLRAAVRRLEADGDLPPASSLVDEALDGADLNPLLERVVRALPGSVIDAALKTDDVLLRAVDDLDLRALLADLDDQDELQRRVERAVTQAVRESLVARVRGLV